MHLLEVVFPLPIAVISKDVSFQIPGAPLSLTSDCQSVRVPGDGVLVLRYPLLHLCRRWSETLRSQHAAPLRLAVSAVTMTAVS